MSVSFRKVMELKVCSVPDCPSKNTTHPNKFFFAIPPEYKKRLAWIKAIGGDPKRTPGAFVCEDHFNIEEDLENYVQFKYYGGGGKRPPIFKQNVVPHIFKCQKNRQDQATCSTEELRRKALVEELLRGSETLTTTKGEDREQERADDDVVMMKNEFEIVVDDVLCKVKMKTEDELQNDEIAIKVEDDDESQNYVEIKTENEAQGATVVKIEQDVKIEDDDNDTAQPTSDSPFFEMEIDPSTVKQEFDHEPAWDPLGDAPKRKRVDGGTQTSPPRNRRDVGVMATPAMKDFSVNCNFLDIPSQKAWKWRCACCPKPNRRCKNNKKK